MSEYNKVKISKLKNPFITMLRSGIEVMADKLAKRREDSTELLVAAKVLLTSEAKLAKYVEGAVEPLPQEKIWTLVENWRNQENGFQIHAQRYPAGPDRRELTIAANILKSCRMELLAVLGDSSEWMPEDLDQASNTTRSSATSNDQEALEQSEDPLQSEVG